MINNLSFCRDDNDNWMKTINDLRVKSNMSAPEAPGPGTDVIAVRDPCDASLISSSVIMPGLTCVVLM